jgi:hypothetical protein
MAVVAHEETPENLKRRLMLQDHNIACCEMTAAIRAELKKLLPEECRSFDLLLGGYINATENAGREMFKPRNFLPYEKLELTYNGKHLVKYFGWFDGLEQFKNAFIYSALNFIKECTK